MKSLHEDRAQAVVAADKLKTFAQPQRLMVLSLLLASGEQNVAEIDQATGIGQPALSQQLAELRKAGMVSTRRQAKQVYYSLADDATRLCVRSIEAVFGSGSPLLDGGPMIGGPQLDISTGAAGFARVIRS